MSVMLATTQFHTGFSTSTSSARSKAAAGLVRMTSAENAGLITLAARNSIPPVVGCFTLTFLRVAVMTFARVRNAHGAAIAERRAQATAPEPTHAGHSTHLNGSDERVCASTHVEFQARGEDALRCRERMQFGRMLHAPEIKLTPMKTQKSIRKYTTANQGTTSRASTTAVERGTTSCRGVQARAHTPVLACWCALLLLLLLLRLLLSAAARRGGEYGGVWGHPSILAPIRSPRGRRLKPGSRMSLAMHALYLSCARGRGC